MEDEIDALHREHVFSLPMLSKQSSIEAEIQKAVESQKIIERYRNGFPALVESARVKYSSSRKMSPGWERALLDFEKMLSERLPSYQEMFSLRLRRENAESEFLRYMAAVFSDYKVSEKAIGFKTPSNSKRYNELGQAIEDAIKEGDAFRQRQFEAVEAAKAQVQKLAQ